MRARCMLTEQFMMKNQFIVNYNDLNFSDIHTNPEAGKNTVCTIVPGTERFIGEKVLTYNRDDLPSKIRSPGENGNTGWVGHDDPEYVRREFWRRWGIFLTKGDLDGIDHKAITGNPVAVEVALPDHCMAAKGTVTFRKCAPPAYSRTVGVLSEGDNGTQDHPFRIEPGKVYDIPFSTSPLLSSITGAYGMEFGDDLRTTFAGDEGIEVLQDDDGHWFLRYWTPMHFHLDVEGGVFGKNLFLSYLDATKQAQLNFTPVRPTETAISLGGSNWYAITRGRFAGDEIVVPRGATMFIPMDLRSPVPMPEVNIAGVYPPSDLPDGVSAYGGVIGGVIAHGLITDCYMYVRNNVTEAIASQELVWRARDTSGNDHDVRFFFKFE